MSGCPEGIHDRDVPLDTQWFVEIFPSHSGDPGKQLSVYFPPAKWYDWYNFEVTSASGGEAITINTPLDHIPVSR